MTPDAPHQMAMLALLNMRPESIYCGTANPKAVARRRKRNKLARLSRRINRQK